MGETEDRETGISEGAVNGEKRRDGAGKLKIARHKENGKYPPQKERKKKKKLNKDQRTSLPSLLHTKIKKRKNECNCCWSLYAKLCADKSTRLSRYLATHFTQ